MPKANLLLVARLAAGGSPLHAQMEYHARLGAVWANDLVRDFIFDEITVRQSIAPMLALGATLPVGPRGYRAGLEGTLASGKFHSREAGDDIDLGTLRTATLQLGLEGPFSTALRWRAGVGGIKYLPSDDEGIFLEGGPIRVLVGASVDYRRAVMPRWDLMLSLGYDFHRFSTDELEHRGFAQSQGVSRVAFTVGLSRRPQ